MYKEYDDPEEAIEDAWQLARSGKIDFKDTGRQVRHVYARSFDLTKDPTLSLEEIKVVLEHGICEYGAENQKDYFRAECSLDCPDWNGRGRVLFKIQEAPTGLTLIITAYRIHGWVPTFSR